LQQIKELKEKILSQAEEGKNWKNKAEAFRHTVEELSTQKDKLDQ
jgi:hypothetical protein